MSGGAGNDLLTGGPGADRFSGGAGKDMATDFTATQGDTSDRTIPRTRERARRAGAARRRSVGARGRAVSWGSHSARMTG